MIFNIGEQDALLFVGLSIMITLAVLVFPRMAKVLGFENDALKKSMD